MFTFGNLNNGYIYSNQLNIPWKRDEVSVSLVKLNIPGSGIIPIDYKIADLTTEGGLYIYCSTSGANGADKLKWQTVQADIKITKKY